MQPSLAVLAQAESSMGLQLWLLLLSSSPRGALRPFDSLLPSCSCPLSSNEDTAAVLTPTAFLNSLNHLVQCCCPHAYLAHYAVCPQTRQSSSIIAAMNLLGLDTGALAHVMHRQLSVLYAVSCCLLVQESARMLP